MAFDYRLKKQKDFDKVFKEGKRLFSDSLTLVYLPSKELKAGFAVGKKHGGSVKRNRIKRLLRESFRSFSPEKMKNFFFVFIPKIKDEYDYHVFLKDMEYLLKKGGFFKDNRLC
ncbi:MAG: ribonuclease P protein component [Clostridia bacterium]|nr:ribonuclease P protein component [Clostridia bacterium]